MIPILLLLLLTLQACSVKKYIPEGEFLYKGGSVEIESKTEIENEKQLQEVLEGVLEPMPNKKVFGMYLGLYYHYLMQKENPGSLTKFFYRKIGENPVYKSDVQEQEVRDLLMNRLENRGFFYSSITSEFEEKNEMASVKYHLKITEPYRLEKYELDSMPEPAYSQIKKSYSNSYFEKNMRLDLAQMKMERQRIDKDMKDAGYYNFNAEFLKFEIDTNPHKKKRFDLFLGLKENVPKKSLVPYKINKINIYAKYDTQDTLIVDVERFNDKNYINSHDYFKSKYLDGYIILKEGQYYNASDSKNTTRRLSSIGLYKYVNLQYNEIERGLTDSIGGLEANIFLSPLNKRALRAELQAVTKSNNFSGLVYILPIVVEIYLKEARP